MNYSFKLSEPSCFLRNTNNQIAPTTRACYTTWIVFQGSTFLFIYSLFSSLSLSLFYFFFLFLFFSFSPLFYLVWIFFFLFFFSFFFFRSSNGSGGIIAGSLQDQPTGYGSVPLHRHQRCAPLGQQENPRQRWLWVIPNLLYRMLQESLNDWISSWQAASSADPSRISKESLYHLPLPSPSRESQHWL